MKNYILTISLFVISLVLIFCIIFPFYNGSGYSVIPMPNLIQKYTENKKLKEALTTSQDLFANSEENVRGFYSIDEEYKRKLDIAVPVKKDIPRTLNNINVLAYENSIELSDFKFSKNINDVKKKDYFTYDVSFSLLGRYDNFLNFISKIEKSLEIYNIKSISISAAENKEQGYEIMKYTLTLEAFEVKNNTK
jgi:Tfp pilus assembly protein PilO